MGKKISCTTKTSTNLIGFKFLKNHPSNFHIKIVNVPLATVELA